MPQTWWIGAPNSGMKIKESEQEEQSLQTRPKDKRGIGEEEKTP